MARLKVMLQTFDNLAPGARRTTPVMQKEQDLFTLALVTDVQFKVVDFVLHSIERMSTSYLVGERSPRRSSAQGGVRHLQKHPPLLAAGLFLLNCGDQNHEKSRRSQAEVTKQGRRIRLSVTLGLVKNIHGRAPGPEVCRACDIAIF
jgi:hypothetical protein